MHQYRLTFIVLLALLAGCQGGTTVVKMDLFSSFPTPVVEPLPLHAAIHYPEPFLAFTHHEESEERKRGDWSIQLGETQRQVFDTIMQSRFRQLTTLESLPEGADYPAPLLMIPQIDDFQFTLPGDTSLNVVEVWIKYSLALHSRQRGKVGEWHFTAYGRTPTAFLTSREEALEMAVQVAMRDAGASLLLGMHRSPAVQSWLASATQSDTTTAMNSPL